MTQKKILTLLLVLMAACGCRQALAQHTLGFSAGYGMASARFDPKQSTEPIWGIYTGGLSWRYYGDQRFVGGFGIDLELLQQGFSFAPNASVTEDKKDYRYYSRKINSVMLPVVWQPHFYLFRNHLRVYLEAAATFSYQLSSTYTNEMAKDAGQENWQGDYTYKLPRDNRWGYGLAGGGGLALLVHRFELNFRARYYFGLSDVVRSRNKYSGSYLDGPANPFGVSPMRSPLDNITISIGLSYRFNKEGFSTWKPRPKREKNKEGFTF